TLSILKLWALRLTTDSLPVRGSQTRTVRSHPTEARRPSGLNATDSTTRVCSRKAKSSCRVATFQIRTVSSSPAEARSWLSGLNATPTATPLGPEKTWSSAQVLASQTRTEPSEPAEATQRPSGLKTTPLTRPVWPSRVARAAPCPTSFKGVASQTRTVWSALLDTNR